MLAINLVCPLQTMSCNSFITSVCRVLLLPLVTVIFATTSARNIVEELLVFFCFDQHPAPLVVAIDMMVVQSKRDLVCVRQRTKPMIKQVLEVQRAQINVPNERASPRISAE